MRLFLSVVLLCVNATFFGQTSRMNNALKIKLAEKSMPGEFYTVLVQGDMAKLHAHERLGRYTINYSAGNIASIDCNASSLAFLIDKGIISYAELNRPRLRPMNDTMVYRNRIKPVKLGTAPLSQPYDGTGVLLGFIDTGIDIAHKDFKDAQGNTRIKFLWDQSATTGSGIPSPFNYGVEWNDTQINAGQCTHSDMAHWGHGTHVAGIGAGNGLANGKHEGCAPKADIVVVAVDFNRSGPVTADAVQYIFDKANQLSKPCVINASVGDYYGSHDGTDLESKLIDFMVANIQGRVMVAAAGNAGYVKYHVKTQANGVDTGFTWLSTNGTTLDYWFYGDTLQVKNLQIGVGANRSDFSDLGRISFRNHTYGLIAPQVDTLKHNGNRIGLVHNSSSINNYGVYELYLHIEADSAGLMWRIETKGTGTHHAWNFDFVSSGLPTVSQYPKMTKYLMPDTMYSIVSSYQCSDEIITVANYVNLSDYYDVNNTLQHTGDIAGALGWSSSSGPTRDGRVKPDIAATGHSTFSSLVTGMQASQIANSPQTVAQGSLHVIGGGTSASAPVVAGLAALYLQAHPEASNQQVKTAIINCAYTDMFTGNVPNYAWGFGKLDGAATMVCGENLAKISEIVPGISVSCFPNPFRNKALVELASAITGHIYIYSTEGGLIFNDTFQGKTYELNGSMFNNNQGLFFVRIANKEKNYTFKLIRE